MYHVKAYRGCLIKIAALKEDAKKAPVAPVQPAPVVVAPTSINYADYSFEDIDKVDVESGTAPQQMNYM